MTRLFSTNLFLILCAFTSTASAKEDVSESRTEVMATSVDRVLEVLSTSDICDKGCKYRALDLVKEVKVSHKAQKDSFYKWSHIDNTRDTKFYTHYQITRGPVTTIKMRTLTKEQDAALIKELEAETKLPHEPIFDVARTEYSVRSMGDKCEVKVHTTTTISGFVGMFPGKVRSSIVASLATLFSNFRL